ncbi:MAG: transporter related-protein [Spartobacteria bacterium]|nr:transporter related-protein [Spartobacteria bacterium]
MIKVENLTKAFGAKIAVNNISFTLERGEVLGFLGPNGAGKSTTMRMITGFIPPSDGKVSVGGHDVVDNPIAAKNLLGYLPEAAPVYVDMTVKSFLTFCAELSGMRGDSLKKAVNKAVELCFLEPVLYQSVDTLSKGYRHRTCLAQSIVHDPPVLVMDEPTDGLDPNQKHEIRTLIRRMGETKAIIFSTHILEEVEAVCSRAIIIDRGVVVAEGTPEQLKRRSELGGAVRISIRGITAPQFADRLSALPQVRKVTVLENNGTATVRVYPQEGIGKDLNGEFIRGLLEASSCWQVLDVRTEEGRLDEVFRNLTWSDTAKKAEATPVMS